MFNTIVILPGRFGKIEGCWDNIDMSHEGVCNLDTAVHLRHCELLSSEERSEDRIVSLKNREIS